MQAASPRISPAELRSALDNDALAGQWILDPRTSSIMLNSKSIWGLVPVKGRFRQISGTATVHGDGVVNGVVIVGAASLETHNSRRDKHLRSADFFDSDAYPYITFAAEAVCLSDQGVTVTGALTVRDRTRRLSFDATPAMHGEGQISLDATVPVDRSEFGITWNRIGMASMHNTITIHAVFARRDG